MYKMRLLIANVSGQIIWKLMNELQRRLLIGSTNAAHNHHAARPSPLNEKSSARTQQEDNSVPDVPGTPGKNDEDDGSMKSPARVPTPPQAAVPLPLKTPEEAMAKFKLYDNDMELASNVALDLETRIHQAFPEFFPYETLGKRINGLGQLGLIKPPLLKDMKFLVTTVCNDMQHKRGMNHMEQFNSSKQHYLEI